MGRFKFRLATLLKLREATRDERRGQLAEAYRADDAVRGQLDSVAGELRRLENHRREATRPGTVDVDHLVDSQRYELVMRSMQSQFRQQRKTLGAEIERRRQALVAADREVRVLENLRQRQADRHRQEENRLEIKNLDEVAVQLAAREAAR